MPKHSIALGIVMNMVTVSPKMRLKPQIGIAKQLNRGMPKHKITLELVMDVVTVSPKMRLKP